MAIKGKLDDAKLRIREDMASGKIEGVPYKVTMSVDRKTIFVEMMDKRMMYQTADMVIDTYNNLKSKGVE